MLYLLFGLRRHLRTGAVLANVVERQRKSVFGTCGVSFVMSRNDLLDASVREGIQAVPMVDEFGLNLGVVYYV